MAKKQTHNAVVYMGQTNGRNNWKTVGRVLHDDEKNKDTLWIDPHAMRNVLNAKGNTGNDIPVLLAPKTRKQLQSAPSAPPWDDPAGLGHGPLCPCPTCQERQTVAASKHEYDTPPDGFDDAIPF